MSAKYQPCNDSEDSLESAPFCEEKDGLISEYQSPRRSRVSRYLNYVLALSLGISLSAHVATLFYRDTGDLDDVCSVYTSQNLSPISQDVKIKYATKTFEPYFMTRSPFTEDPSEEVDQAWLSLGVQARHYRVPEESASKWNITPGYAKYDPQLGGGYPVLFEFSHHLHCVNLLRQAASFNYDYYRAKGKGAFRNHEDVLKEHVYHCIDTLRQVIMCQPDTGVFGQYWINDIGRTFVDFKTDHKCKNFEELRDWVMEHQVSEDFSMHSRVVQRPGDAVFEKVP